MKILAVRLNECLFLNDAFKAYKRNNNNLSYVWMFCERPYERTGNFCHQCNNRNSLVIRVTIHFRHSSSQFSSSFASILVFSIQITLPFIFIFRILQPWSLHLRTNSTDKCSDEFPNQNLESNSASILILL